jgi:hypothetical protein
MDLRQAAYRTPKQSMDGLSQPMPLAQAVGTLVESSLRAGREIRFTITTSSMWPALARGDEIVVRTAGPEALRPGDIAFLKSGKIWLAHRLIGVRGEGAGAVVLTKADNYPQGDLAHPSSQLYGRVVAVARAGREASLDSARARWLGGVLARLSGAQASLWRKQPGPLRRVALKGLGRVVRWGARAGRYVVGLR